ncbi:hypothetical protein KI427_26950 (plasmid) [Rhodococcus ruber]|uniref:hypothetical protein n=2 Tax=Rhodococcus TaxID=1827 RepID=UPI0007D9E7D4|nr:MULTISPECIES: hypothetical protein [Rhodococcus]QXU56486.1 hypothetical protein KXC42_25280 [Rhodococcus sp. LW-XY12]MCT7294052.1 hypothetical protein [Rhodococcus sp. PAE-6]UQB75853.1 hypothetical protein KI427_26950 [Rhodococcus ruber]WML66217.1 hypothetical protein QNA09_28400 [Rhodococcus sp. AH-ZY2]WML66286.1 hypothetical protein QNA09_28795 [Rhodococcus sp. AH-ZY2]
MKLGKTTFRHPAVVDLLGGAPTPPSGATADPVAPGDAIDGALVAPAVTPHERPVPRTARRTGRVAAVAIAIAVGVAAVTIGVMWNARGEESAAAAPPSDDVGTPMLELSATPTAPASDLDDDCRADRGDQRSGAGVIAAWNYAYYVRRDAVAARALATPNSSVVPAEQLQPFIDEIPVGTNYCVRTKALSEDVYLVDLSELRPDGVQRITQTVTTQQIDGTWFVDVFN